MVQKKQVQRAILLSVPVKAEEKAPYLKKWGLLKEKSAREYSNASVDGMMVCRKYAPQARTAVDEIGYVVRLIHLLHPDKLMENNRRVSEEDLNEAVLLAEAAPGNPARIVIFRDDGLFVLAKRNGAQLGER